MRRYEPLIRAVVARLRLPCGCERGDIAQEARIGLVRAIWAWRPERGPFGAFASSCARDEAIKAIDTAGARKHQLLSRAVSLHSVSAAADTSRHKGTRRVRARSMSGSPRPGRSPTPSAPCSHASSSTRSAARWRR